MHIAVSFALVVAFLAMNAFFVIAEFALVRVRKSQLELAVEQGKRGAKAAKEIADNVNAYLSACQLGVTLSSLALGWLGEPAFSSLIHPLFNMIGLPDAVVSAISVAIGYFIMTTLHVVVGELIPKSFAIFATEKYALSTAAPLMWFYRVTYPIMLLFNGITNAVVKLTGHDPGNEHDVYTGDEIKLLIDESTESGLIDPDQNEYVDNIFDLGDKDAEAIMTPRTDLVCLDTEDSLTENLMVTQKYKFTRYPVCKGSKDHLIGFVHVKDLYRLPEGATVDDLPIRELYAVPETVPVAKLLQTLQERRSKIAVVVDEHGGTAGIVTISDIIGQIVGRLDDEYVHGTEQELTTISDGSYVVDGSMAIDDLEELIGFRPEESDECETAGGLLLAALDRIPDEGDSVELEDKDTKVSLTVLDMDSLRIEKISVVVTPKSKSE